MSAPFIRPVSPFVVATLTPIPLLALGGLFGGYAILAAVLYMTVLCALLDILIATARSEAGPGSEFPAAEQLSRVLGWAHFPLLLIGVAGLSGVTGLGLWEGIGVLLAFGLFFGQVSNSNAHELIHRTDKRLFQLGKWVLISLLYGHHVTAHLKIHHRFVATPDDPNSARLGDGFWRFAPVAWFGAFVAGWEIEKSIAKLKERELPIWQHPYLHYVGGALGFLVLATLLFGASGLVAYLMLAAYAQLQLLLSDYVQHYGLKRRKIEDDRYEQVAPWHSWNAPHWFSGGLMLNAPRHSEHHTNPARPYPELSLPAADEGPRLPFSLPVMATVALVPPLWRRLMGRRAERWQARIDDGLVERRPPPPLRPASQRPERSRIWKRGKRSEDEGAAVLSGAGSQADMKAAAAASLAEMPALAALAAEANPPEPAPEPEDALPDVPEAAQAPEMADEETGDPLPDPAAPPQEARLRAEAVAPEPESSERAPEPAEPPEAEPEGEGRALMRRLEAAEAGFAAEPTDDTPPPRRPDGQRPEGGTRTSDLWASVPPAVDAAPDPEPEELLEEAAGAPAPRSARSATLFRPEDVETPEPEDAYFPPVDEEDMFAEQDESGPAGTEDLIASYMRGEAEVEPEPEPEPEEEEPPAPPPDAPDGVAAAISRLFASLPKPPTRASQLPSIPAEHEHEPPPAPGHGERLRLGLSAAPRAARALAALLRGAPPQPRRHDPEDMS